MAPDVHVSSGYFHSFSEVYDSPLQVHSPNGRQMPPAGAMEGGWETVQPKELHAEFLADTVRLRL